MNKTQNTNPNPETQNKTQCMHRMDEWGNYHSKLVLGDDVVVKYSYFSGRAPRESWYTVVITIDKLVFEFARDGESLETRCHEYGTLNNELINELIREVEREASENRIHKFEVNEENLEKASAELREFVEKLKQAYYCNAYPYFLFRQHK